jgi:hypothetical protein
MTDWDVSQRYTPAQRFLLRRRPSLQEAELLNNEPWLQPWWEGPTDIHQAVICDAVMVAFGEFLAKRQADRNYAFSKIMNAAQRVRKHG